MIGVEEARARILAPLRATPSEVVALADAWNRIAAEPVIARLTHPPADVSAMDGYALRADDGAAGARLRVIGDAPAGHPFAGRVGPGEAVRLFTGSLVPDGADAILPQEGADRSGEHVTVRETVARGRHIRRAGQDFAAGDLLIPPGHRLTARDIGLAAAANHPWLSVHRRPRVALLATGDEIVMPGEAIPPGGIVSSNTHALAAFARVAGAEPVILPVARDDLAAIAGMADAVAGLDLFVITGGASVGDHDLVARALALRGFALNFWKVAMRPGKPLLSGTLGSTPVLGLPGNPVSALVCAALFMVPAIDRLAGGLGAPLPTTTARLGAPVKRNDQRADYLRASLRAGEDGELTATPFPAQDSAMLRRLASADALIPRPPDAPALEEGARVSVIPLRWSGL